MDVAAWLKGLGLERYVPAFCDNDVDAEVLPKLTADDLIGLGVTSIGHRRKLLDAIATFGAEGPGTTVTTAPQDAPPPADFADVGVRAKIQFAPGASCSRQPLTR